MIDISKPWLYYIHNNRMYCMDIRFGSFCSMDNCPNYVLNLLNIFHNNHFHNQHFYQFLGMSFRGFILLSTAEPPILNTIVRSLAFHYIPRWRCYYSKGITLRYHICFIIYETSSHKQVFQLVSTSNSHFFRISNALH